MKAKLFVATFLAAAGLSQGAVTLSFSNTTNYLSNFANGSGSSDGAGARMVWGLIVDAGGNGFSGSAATPYTGGFSLAANANGLAMTTTLAGGGTQVTDDVLFIASSVMAQNSAANDGAPIGMNRILGFSNLNYGGQVNQGDAFKIVWFDALAFGGSAAAGLKYGEFTLPVLNTLPADPGTYDFTAQSAGPDPLKTMSFALSTPIPEPSVAVLGALGVLGLMRRRR